MKCIKIVREPQNNGYAKAVIITAIVTAVAETAAIITCRMLSVALRKKKEEIANDDGFDIRIDDGDCKVTFEASEVPQEEETGKEDTLESEEETDSDKTEN